METTDLLMYLLLVLLLVNLGLSVGVLTKKKSKDNFMEDSDYNFLGNYNFSDYNNYNDYNFTPTKLGFTKEIDDTPQYVGSSMRD